MKVYLVQLDIVWRNKTANFAKVRQLLAEAKVVPGSLVVLPEMFATGFDVKWGQLAEGTPDGLHETGAFLSELAQEWNSYVQGGGITPGLPPKCRNVIEAYSPQGQRLALFTKLHPFTYGGEHKRFEKGQQIVSFVAPPFQVAPFLCYDLRFPEVFRQAVRKGAQVFTVAANWPQGRQSHWKPLLQARAIENQAYVIGVNRCGSDQFLHYAGESVVFGPTGQELACVNDQEGVLEVELDPVPLQQWRQEFPVLADIQPSYLGDL